MTVADLVAMLLTLDQRLHVVVPTHDTGDPKRPRYCKDAGYAYRIKVDIQNEDGSMRMFRLGHPSIDSTMEEVVLIDFPEEDE